MPLIYIFLICYCLLFFFSALSPKVEPSLSTTDWQVVASGAHTHVHTLTHTHIIYTYYIHMHTQLLPVIFLCPQKDERYIALMGNNKARDRMLVSYINELADSVQPPFDVSSSSRVKWLQPAKCYSVTSFVISESQGPIPRLFNIGHVVLATLFV